MRKSKSSAAANGANTSYTRDQEMKLEDIVMMQYIEELRKSMKLSLQSSSRYKNFCIQIDRYYHF